MGNNEDTVLIRADRLNEDKYERSKRLHWLDLDRVMDARVLIVGVGAIGNETTKNLVLSGFKNYSLIDMDYVVRSNLNRCLWFTDEDADERRMKVDVIAKRMEELDSSVNVETYTSRIEEMPEDFIPSHDIVLGCLDNIAARLHVNAHCYLNKLPFIDAATLGFIGKVQVINPGAKGACFECGLNKTHRKILEKRFSCTGIDVTFFQDKFAAEITTTAIVSAVQVREALKYVSGHPEILLDNLFYYDATRNVADVLEISVNPDCSIHMLDTTEDISLEELMAETNPTIEDDELEPASGS